YRYFLVNAPGRYYELIEAEDGRAGLELCARENPDCLLLDFMLPDMTGLEFLAAVRNNSGILPCPVVMLTGISDERVAVQAMKLGATDYVAKSETVGEILDHAISAAIEKFRLQQQLEQGQSALAAREELYRTLLEAMPQLVWTSNSRGQLEHVNRRWVEYTGLTPGTERNWQELLHPDDYQRSRDPWRNAVERRTEFEVEHRLRRASDGAYRWHLARAVPMEFDGGQDVKWLGTSTDVENQKEAERALQQRQKWESIGLLAGGIAHDFNNLLVGILGGASYVSDTLAQEHPAQTMLNNVMQASERAAHLTRQMLAYAGKGRFFIEPVDLAALVPRTTELIQASIPKNVHLRLELPDNLPPVQTDSGQMQQVIMNLIVNALEAIPDNHDGAVVVRAFAAHAGLREGNRASCVVLEVRDTGMGMDEETKSKIFDPFFTTKFTGRGLGLAAVHGIVRSSGGLITVESAPGRGSIFRVSLPVAVRGLPEKTAAPRRPVVPESQRVDATVLVIDDEMLVLEIARVALERAGARVICASDGETGLNVLRERSRDISLVLLDLGMPLMNGREVLVRMRGAGLTVPVVICSGYSEQEVYRQLDTLEIAGLVPKPFTASNLVGKVKAVLEERQVRLLEI
ncbi:MAG: response regulator, partial [Acidobacteriota bacterium]